MTRDDVKSMDDLVRYAQFRSSKSLQRNDPIAYAYWRETESFARASADRYRDPSAWAEAASTCAARARTDCAPMEAALWYSRAKWFVIMGRNCGLRMSPAVTKVTLDWLREREAERRAS